MPADHTADPHEVEKFGRLAGAWWDPNGPFAALHRMNPLRLALIREALAAARPAGTLNGLRVLDVGCGGGLASVPLARLGADVLGVDASEEAVAVARAYAADAGLSLRFEVGVAEHLLPAYEQRFGLIVALEIVEHVESVRDFLAALARLLAPGGVLFLSTINRTPQARALALFAAERLLRMAPEGAHEYDRLVMPAELEAALPELHWSPPVGVAFNPLARSWRRSRDLSMNYARWAVKP